MNSLKAPVLNESEKLRRNKTGESLRVAGLFAGIGGIELGLSQAGHKAEFFCEIEPAAQAVLTEKFKHSIPIIGDIRDIEELPDVDIVTAGFPCQDLSPAGRTAGIFGQKSGVVSELFRLLSTKHRNPKWLLIENVPFMLQLHRGKAMEYLTKWLEENGFNWAYRVVNAQSFGVPQRRLRVLLLASRTEDPRSVLFRDDYGHPPEIDEEDSACGFYWTEGNKGLGWAVDAVPTLKSGSSIGIPSPPAIWMRNNGGDIVQPDIRDAERLQGFPEDWTAVSQNGKVVCGVRWKLVGNAVCVPIAKWVGECINNPVDYNESSDTLITQSMSWPKAAWYVKGRRAAAAISPWPIAIKYQHLSEFLSHPPKPLSLRASLGFYNRLTSSSLRVSPEFKSAMETHILQKRSHATQNR